LVELTICLEIIYWV